MPAPPPLSASPATREPPAAFRGVFRDDLNARAVYAEAAGIQRIWPAAIAVPHDADAVTTLVRWARRTGTPLVPRGSGTSMAGGAIGSGVIVDLSRLRGTPEIDVATRRIIVGPGTLCDEVDATARTHNLRFPVDPSSGAYCTVGGMVSTNAAGAHSLKYGPTRRWVRSVDCVFADGTRATVRRGAPPPGDIAPVANFLATVSPAIRAARPAALAHPGVRKESSGYALADYARSADLVDLLVGSEGTLAVFVGVELELAPIPPATATLLAAFPALEAAVAGSDIAREAGASAVELLDRTFLDFVREAAVDSRARDLPTATDAVLLIEVEGDSPAAVHASAAALARALSAGAASRVDVALDAAAERALWELRHAASPALARLDPALKSMQLIEDGAVPPAHLAAYVRGVREALARYDMRGAIFGHAGDGHIHVNPLVNVRDPRWRWKLESLLADVTALTARLGGTLSGEHGDGRLRTPLLSQIWRGDNALALDLFRAVKDAFDPLGIFNPGVKVPTPGEPLIGDVKYDPALPALPDPARRVLDRVADDRAYAEPRLSLLEQSGGSG